MKEIEKGIVFSNDIERILKGNNALGYSYEENGLIIPNSSFIESLRNDFEGQVNTIFEGEVRILSEDEMLEAIYSSISDVLGRYPHCFIR